MQSSSFTLSVSIGIPSLTGASLTAKMPRPTDSAESSATTRDDQQRFLEHLADVPSKRILIVEVFRRVLKLLVDPLHLHKSHLGHDGSLGCGMSR